MTDQRDDTLFVTDEWIGRRLLGSKRASCFMSIVPVLERTGFPPKDPTFGGRYWPAVKAWLDRRYGLTKADAPQRPGGREDFTWQDERKRQA